MQAPPLSPCSSLPPRGSDHDQSSLFEVTRCRRRTTELEHIDSISVAASKSVDQTGNARKSVMTPIEKLKREFELAAEDTKVRLGQARDHLVWTRVDSDGDQYNVYIFWLDDDTGSVIQVYPSYYNLYKNSSDFLESIVEWRESFEAEEYEFAG